MSTQTVSSPNTAGNAPEALYNTLTLARMFRQTVERTPHKTVLMAKKDGRYQGINYNELRDRVHRFASALIENGLQPGDRVALLSENRPEWVVADLGTLHAASCDVPIYPTLTPQQIAYLLNDSGARFIVLSNAVHLQKILEVEADLTALEGIVIFDDPQGATSSKKLWRLEEFLDLGQRALEKHRPEIDRRVELTRAEDIASIVYTSGTTGEPKGAMLTHRNFVSNTVTCTPILGYTSADLELSILPLCHVFERLVYYSGLFVGVTIAYAESFDTVAANLAEVKPTFVPAVPRLFEKIHTRILEGVQQGSALRRSLFHWAMGVGRRYRQIRQGGDRLSSWLAFQHRLAHRLVFSKLQQRVGGRVRHFISGGAPLRRDIAEFFADAGLIILEGYGLTETSPVITLNHPDHYRFGTVGQPIPDVEVKIAEDGEILARGPNVMKGYWNKPEATAEAIDGEGWFHTGDIGVLDAEGFLTITDRKKELLVLSNGKKVAPQPIENLLKSSPFIEQGVVIGDNRNFVSALIVPKFDQLRKWADQRKLTHKEAEELVDHPEVKDLFEAEVARINQSLAQFEKVKKFTLLQRDFVQDLAPSPQLQKRVPWAMAPRSITGELTPTLKFKRRVILKHFKDDIEAMYAG